MRPEFVIERQGRTMVLYSGLLDLAHERGLVGIETRLIQIPNAENGHVAIAHARAMFVGEKSTSSYDGIGDASAANVGRNIAPHIIRMAETRAKARALRDAVNIGMVAAEEMGDAEEESAPRPKDSLPTTSAPAAGPSTGPTSNRPVPPTADEEVRRILEQPEPVRATVPVSGPAAAVPASKGNWERWHALTDKANALGIPFEPAPKDVSYDRLKTMYEALREQIVKAEGAIPAKV